MASGRVLVVAPATEMRRSLAFVLTAEGHDVTAIAHFDFDHPEAASRYDCVVLDHQALQGSREAAIACVSHLPVVLVTSKPIDWLAGAVRRVVEKPLAGDAVVNAVNALVVAEKGEGGGH